MHGSKRKIDELLARSSTLAFPACAFGAMIAATKSLAMRRSYAHFIEATLMQT
jgi:hypothetical protein